VGGSTIGHVGLLTEKELEQVDDVDADDVVGASGIEQAFQERLGGSPTRALNVVDKRGRVLRVMGRVLGEPGRNLKVTLDIELQRVAERAYGETVGGAVVMQPSTGDLLAIVDSSSFDPNNFVGAEGVEPFNRALIGGYPPGSAMKVVTASAALDTSTVTPSTIVTGPKEYKGVRNFESGEFGEIPFSSAVKFSVNTAFAQIAEELGAEKMTKYAGRFGFNRPVEMALQAREPSYPEPVGLADLMWSAVGQAQVLASPMQMASVAATIANDGKRMEPRIDTRVRPHGVRAVSRKTAEELTVMMTSVVEGGTGVNARIAGVSVAGKTGTAEVDVAGERKNHAWFICFAPVGNESLAVAVVSEYGGIGGKVAAPLARSILINTLPLAP
jgi:cell division protein FtsI/penicillin-binding protein 2